MDSINKLKYLIAAVMLLSAFATSAQAQAGKTAKPRLMIIPSDSYCERNGFVTSYKDENGETHQAVDYGKAVKNEEFRNVVAKFSEMMNQRELPLINLEASLKNIKQENMEVSLMQSESGSGINESPLDILKRTAKPDIILDLDFSVKRHGPQKYISYNLQGIDAYSQKNISAVSGSGEPSETAPVGTLLESAVIEHIDNFNKQLKMYFSDLFSKGREIKIVIKVWESSPFKLNSDVSFNGHTVRLDQVILRGWLAKKCMGGTFSTTNTSSTELRLEQVHIPLMEEDEIFGGIQMVDAMSFVQELGSWLKSNYNISCGIYGRGLGEAHLIIGEKEN